MTLVQDKIFRVHQYETEHDYTSGMVHNLASNDADNCMSLCWNAWAELWASPLTLLVCVIWLCMILGVAALVGTAIMVLSLFITAGPLARASARTQQALMRKGDTRISIYSEFVQGMKLIKLYAWEALFGERISNSRKDQLSSLKSMLNLSCGTRFISFAMPLMVGFASLVFYQLTGNTLDTARTFTALLLFTTMREPLGKLPEATNLVVRVKLSAERITKFLLANEFQDYQADTPKLEGNSLCIMSDAAFSWQPPSRQPPAPPVLQHVNVKITRGQLIIVVGPVGCGKSTILHALLGELFPTGGRVQRSYGRGDIAYCPQTAYLRSDTVRNNILFGAEFELEHYLNTVTSCALVRDLELLSEADLSFVGENGGDAKWWPAAAIAARSRCLSV